MMHAADDVVDRRRRRLEELFELRQSRSVDVFGFEPDEESDLVPVLVLESVRGRQVSRKRIREILRREVSLVFTSARVDEACVRTAYRDRERWTMTVRTSSG